MLSGWKCFPKTHSILKFISLLYFYTNCRKLNYIYFEIWFQIDVWEKIIMWISFNVLSKVCLSLTIRKAWFWNLNLMEFNSLSRLRVVLHPDHFPIIMMQKKSKHSIKSQSWCYRVASEAVQGFLNLWHKLSRERCWYIVVLCDRVENEESTIYLHKANNIKE